MITRRQTVLLTLVTTMALAGACANAGCGGSSSTDSNAGAGQGAGATLPDSGIGVPDSGISHPSTGFGISPQGGTITGATTGGGLVVTTGKLGIDSSGFASGNAVIWNGSAFTHGAGGITNAAGANVIPKSDGTNLVASALSDDGTKVTTSEPVVVGDFRGTAQASTVTGTQNDFAINATATILRWNGASNATFTGFTGGTDGRILVVENVTGNSLVFSAESGSSTAANRLWLLGPSNQIVLNSPAGNPNSFATFVYDGTSSRWRMQSYNSQRVDVGMEWVQASQFDGTLAVTGLSTLTGGFTSAAASTMTAPLTVQDFRGTEISPAGITGATNDWAPTGLSTATTILVTSSSGAILLNGLTGGATGRRIVIVNADAAQPLTIRHENTGSTTTNRIDTQYNDDILLPAGVGASVSMEYYASRWHVEATNTYAFGPNTLTNNTLPKGSSTYLANSLLTDDGTTFRVNSTFFTVTEANGNTSSLGFGDFKSGVYGGNGATADTVYITQDRLGFAYGTNAASTGKINSVGYLEGTTQFRNLEIDDGKGNPIAYFGQAASAPAGNTMLRANIDTTTLDLLGTTQNIGKDTASVNSFSNGPTGINRADAKHFEWTEEFMWGGNASTSNDSSIGAMGLLWHRGTTAIIGDDSASIVGRWGITALKTGVATTGDMVAITGGKGIAFNQVSSITAELTSAFDVLSSSTNSVASEYIAIFGISDSAYNGTSPDLANGCYFTYDKGNVAAGNKNAGNVDAWECWCAGASTRTGYLINNTGNSDESFALGVGTIAAATFYRMKIVVTGTTRAEFYRNGTKVCDINTNMPTSTSLGIQFLLLPKASTGTGDRHWQLDQATFKGDLTSARNP